MTTRPGSLIVHVFRPNAGAWWGRVGRIGRIVLAGAVVIGIPLVVLGIRNSRLLAVEATAVGLGAVIAIYIHNVRLEIDTEEVRLYGMFGGHKRWQRSSIKGFQVLEVMFRGVGRSKPIAVAYARDHHALFTLEASLWLRSDLRSMTQELGGREGSEMVTNKEAIERYPGCLTFADRHYWLVGGCIPVLAIALIFVLAPFCAPGP